MAETSCWMCRMLTLERGWLEMLVAFCYNLSFNPVSICFIRTSDHTYIQTCTMYSLQIIPIFIHMTMTPVTSWYFPWRSFCVLSWCPALSNGPCSVAAFRRNCGPTWQKPVWIEVWTCMDACNFQTIWQIIQDAQAVVSCRSLRAKAQCFMDVHSLWIPLTWNTRFHKHTTSEVRFEREHWTDCTDSVYQATASLATARVRESGMPVVTCLIENIKKQLSAQNQVATLLNAHHSLARTHPLHTDRIGFWTFCECSVPMAFIDKLKKMNMELRLVVS